MRILLLLWLGGLVVQAASSPNMVLILTDDQGWNNTQVPMIQDRPDTRSDYYLTPNLRRMADAGMTFSQAYAPHPVCSPSRHSILFGVTPAKLKKTTNQGFNYPSPVETPAIPQVLKQADPAYRAAHFGKWHMYGHPADFGYDASDGRTNNQTGRQLSTDQTRFWPHEDPKRSVSITGDSIQFIKHQATAGNPFYLQISHYFIHLSAEAKPATLEKHRQRPAGEVHSAYWYAAMLDDLDQSVGLVLDLLEELGLMENTYVFFTSDNGGTARQFPNFNKPLRGGKGSYYEGGIRVPFFAMGPGIEAGTYSDVPIVGYDLLPTFAKLAGFGEPLPPEIEGGSFADILFNAGMGTVRRERKGIYFCRQVDAVLIQEPFKLIKTHRDNQLELFDLSKDLSEQRNLVNELPSVTESLHGQLTEWMDDVGAMTSLSDAPRGRRARRLGN